MQVHVVNVFTGFSNATFTLKNGVGKSDLDRSSELT